MEVHRTVPAYAKAGGSLHGVDVGPEEEKLPAVLLLFLPHHGLHFIAAVAMAGVFHAIGRDDKDGVLRTIFLPGVFVDVGDMVDRAADGVDQCGPTADKVLAIRHRLDLPHVHPVVDDRAVVGEKHRGDDGLPLRLLLALDHAVEAADGVGLQAGHGAALVENEHHFRQVLFHG